MKIYKHLLVILLCSLFAGSCTVLKQKQSAITWEKPKFLKFGMEKNSLKSYLEAEGYQVIERNITPIELPTAKQSQIQLDVTGIYYGGKPRFVELIFADGILDMMWILTDAEEEQIIKTHLATKFGEPSHELPGAWFYLEQQTALRNDPHEVLFISKRLKEPYRQWLNSMSEH